MVSKKIKHIEGRLVDHPKIKFSRGKEISFFYNNNVIRGIEGESIAASLYASGQRIFSRSFKLHRPRGLLCVSGKCPNCMMRVNGIPNIRTCVEPVRNGIHVNHQNAWPSLTRDILSTVDRFSSKIHSGFQYRNFSNNKLFWPLLERILRIFSGIGRIPDIKFTNPQSKYKPEVLEIDIAVIGGGPSGMKAAITSSLSGAKVVMVDDND